MKCICHYSEFHEPLNILVSYLFTNDKKDLIDLVNDRSKLHTFSLRNLSKKYYVLEEVLATNLLQRQR